MRPELAVGVERFGSQSVYPSFDGNIMRNVRDRKGVADLFDDPAVNPSDDSIVEARKRERDKEKENEKEIQEGARKKMNLR